MALVAARVSEGAADLFFFDPCERTGAGVGLGRNRGLHNLQGTVLSRHHEGPFKSIAELAKVSWPGVVEHPFPRRGRDRKRRSNEARREVDQHPLGNSEQIATPLAQRRQAETQNIEAKQEVGPKSAAFRALGEIFRADREESNVGGRVAPSERGVDALGEQAEEFSLQSERNLVNPIEHQTAPFSECDPTFERSFGSREGARLDTEELRFEQRFGDADRVELDQPLGGAGTREMDCAGERRATAPSFSHDQDWSVARCRSMHTTERFREVREGLERGDGRKGGGLANHGVAVRNWPVTTGASDQRRSSA